jgi:hypothetical protein
MKSANRLLPLAACLGLLGGCQLFRPKPEPPDAKVAARPAADKSKYTADGLVRYLNNQAALVESIEARDINLTAKGPGGNPPTLDGVLLVQKPHYFKLTGRSLMGQEVLLGSNQERFWFYVPRMQDALMHCSYRDFETGKVDLPFPFDPDWVLEALGMARVPEDGVKKIEFDDKTGTVRLIEDATLHGQRVKKVTVCYQLGMDRNVPQVKARIVYDERGRVMCSATTKSVTRIPVNKKSNGEVTYATVPQVVKLEWPALETELVIDLGKARINGQLPMESFQMPQIGARQIDLGRDRPTGRSGVVPARFR